MTRRSRDSNTLRRLVSLSGAVALSSVVLAACSSAPVDTTATAEQRSDSDPYLVVPQDLEAALVLRQPGFNPLDYVDPLCDRLWKCHDPCAVPDYEDPFGAAAALCLTAKGQIAAMLVGLRVLAMNGDPPSSFADNAAWNDFVEAANEKGTVHISDMTIRCQGDQVIPFDDGAYTHAQGEYSLGWTKEAGFSLPNGPEGKDGYNYALNVTVGASCVNYRLNEASRIAWEDRAPLYATLGLNASFIYIESSVDVCCDQSVTINVGKGLFPSLYVWYGGQQVGMIPQNGLVDFMTSEGVPQRPSFYAGPPDWPGQGDLEPAGTSLQSVQRAFRVYENAPVTE